MKYKAQVKELAARLPELVWQLSQINTDFSAKIPAGVFREPILADKTLYIKEIKKDLDKLEKEDNQTVALMLAKKIERKINILVLLCRELREKDKAPREEALFSKAITTRKAWIAELKSKEADLTLQKEALEKKLTAPYQLVESIITLQAELGKIEKQLTVIYEAYKELSF